MCVLIVLKTQNYTYLYWKQNHLVAVLHELRSGHFQPPLFFSINLSYYLKKYVSPEMSTKLFINDFIGLFIQNRDGYIRCVSVGGGGGSHPFFRQINIKNTINRVK